LTVEVISSCLFFYFLLDFALKSIAVKVVALVNPVIEPGSICETAAHLVESSHQCSCRSFRLQANRCL